MCCLSKASSHFVVFVCTNPDRKPSRKMKRRNKIADYSYFVLISSSLMRCGFGARTHDRASLLSTFDLRLATCNTRATPESLHLFDNVSNHAPNGKLIIGSYLYGLIGSVVLISRKQTNLLILNFYLFDRIFSVQIANGLAAVVGR